MNVKRGMTFAAALRAFLRQDPDVIMVGEIRDLETAEIAIKAAQTGHMVLSTLHTNDAPQTMARLMNMGIAPYNITSSVTLDHRAAPRAPPARLQEAAWLPAAALLAEGFTQAAEWWHWSYGDRYWAFTSGHPTALYGPVASEH